jgi:predicted neuraminidase
MTISQRLLAGLAICLALAWADVSLRAAPPAAAQAVWPHAANMQVSTASASANRLAPQSRGFLPMPANTPSAHAGNLLAMPKNHRCALMAFWFAGARESAPDVQIAQSCFERASQQWLPARFVANRFEFGAQLGFGLRRLGNSVSWLDRDGKIHLFVVATGWGGWAAGRILHLRQSDSGIDPAAPEFASPKVLPLSWLWNISYLVRGAPMPLADGGMMLPVYFELGLKYPVALRFDARGDFKGMTRLSNRTHVLQPNLVAVGDAHWLALMRDNRIDGHVAIAQTTNAGQDWQDVPQTKLINPDTSIAALALAPDRLLLAHNSSPRARRVLDLSESRNGVDWTLALNLARGEPGTEFSYPTMTWADGSVWVAYTENRKRIAWARFNFESAPK